MQGHRTQPPRIVSRTLWPASVGIAVIDSGVSKDTATQIARVRAEMTEAPSRARTYAKISQECADDAWDALVRADLQDLAGAVNGAHCSMRDWQAMSTRRIETLRDIVLASGFAGAKLTGAGRGGALFAIAKQRDMSRLVRTCQAAIREAGLQGRVTAVCPDAVGLTATTSCRFAP